MSRMIFNLRFALVSCILAPVGAVLLLVYGVHLTRLPWDLEDKGVRAEEVEPAEHSYLLGERYQIRVNGEIHECSGGDRKISSGRPAVLYDPEQPSRCRLEATAGALGKYELAGLLGASGFLCVGLAGLLWSRRYWLHKWRGDALTLESADLKPPTRAEKLVLVVGGLAAATSGLFLALSFAA